MTGCVVGIAYKNEGKIAQLMDRAKLCKGTERQRRGAHICLTRWISEMPSPYDGLDSLMIL